MPLTHADKTLGQPLTLPLSSAARLQLPAQQAALDADGSPWARPTALEICAGGGGQALGLERAGFRHTLLIEMEPDACHTLRTNRPDWNVLEKDLRAIPEGHLVGNPVPLSLLAAGVPCPPFSAAGRQLGQADERDLFPVALSIAEQLQPMAVLFENVKGLMHEKFDAYRSYITARLNAAGYAADWRLLRACDFGVPQLRPRAVLVAMRPDFFSRFRWPAPVPPSQPTLTVGQTLHRSMASNGWELADAWAAGANQIAPTICGGSRRHGGADLGPSGARKAWARMGVNGSSLADALPKQGDTVPVRLTIDQIAKLQGFPCTWRFSGSKTARYRQIGNAFPPPVAQAVGASIAAALGYPA